MKSFSFTLITILIVGVLGVGGYFAVRSLKDPSSYIPKTTPSIGDLHKLETEPQSAVVTNTPPPITETPVVDPVSNDLKTNIQGLIDKKIVLKIGSKGVNVGYVQQFVNRYFKKNLKIDNDFGKTLETNIKTFQKANGITQTGQVGPTTLAKMITWLDKNPE